MSEMFSSGVLLTIIVCCTVIVLGLIGLSAYRIKCQSKKSWASYIFSASVILILSITIFSTCFYNNRNVLDFISLASALISIILAVVTIIYSYFINSNSSSQIEKLNKAAEDVRNATSSYTVSATSLQENIQKIIFAVSRVEANTAQILEYSKLPGSKENNNLENFNLEKYIQGFVSIASPIGLLAMYACVKSNDYKKDFNLNMLKEENFSYSCGFLIATCSTGLISLSIDIEKGGVSVNSYIPFVKQALEKWFEKQDKNSFIVQMKNKVDSFFISNK